MWSRRGCGTRWAGVSKPPPATFKAGDPDKDLCLLTAPGLVAEPARLGKAARLKVGDPVYAVGAPQGLELSLSEGIVSQLRGGPPPIIQTTVAISPGSSGGGLFNAQGELVGITTFYLKDSQSLNFAVPVEWIGEVAKGKIRERPIGEVPGATEPVVPEVAPPSVLTSDLAKKVFEQGRALYKQENFSAAIPKLEEAVRLDPTLARAYYILGWTYNQVDRSLEALECFQKALALKRDALTYDGLAWTYNKLGRHSEAVAAGEQAVKLEFHFPDAHYNVGMAYLALGNLDMARKEYDALLNMQKEKAKAKMRADMLRESIIKP